MKLLVTGKGTSGSWQIRGEQLGKAMNAKVQRMAPSCDGFDRIILVKRPVPALMDVLRKRTCPLIWDIVDSWPQPIGNEWSKGLAMHWLRETLNQIRPEGIIAPTDAMRRDLQEVTTVPVLWLPHHARPGFHRHKTRDKIQAIGYEGGTNYLEGYMQRILEECGRRDWAFLVNPMDYHAMDIVLAVRGCSGYAPTHWKSNVKLANAQANGMPIICNREFGYLETATQSEVWCESPDQLGKLFDFLEPKAVRSLLSDELRDNIITVDDMAGRLLQWLRSRF